MRPATAWNEFGVRFRSKDRKHGEPFPLPRLSRQRRGGEPPSSLTRRVDASFKTLNDLASAPFDAAAGSLPLTQSQKWIMDDVWRRVAHFGDCPLDLDEQGVISKMASKANLYTGEAAHPAEFDMQRIKILHRRRPVLPAKSLLPEHAAIFLEHFRELIEKSPSELEADMETQETIEPYWDPKLRGNKQLRYKFYQALSEAGLLTFRRRRKGRVGFFVVRKKDGWQRLIVDARVANQNHRRPPTTRLSTASGLADVDFVGEAMDGQGEVMQLQLPSMAAGDVGDCFYNFSVECMASWFCADDRETVADLKRMGFEVGMIFDDSVQDFVEPSDDEAVFFAFKGMCMGWSWALWLANEIVANQSSIGSGLSEERFIRDKRPAPTVTQSSPAIGVYVDNVNVIGMGSASVNDVMDSVADRFARLGIPFEITDRAGGKTLETLGLEFDFSDGCVVRNTRHRAWKLWLATKGMIKRQRLSGELVRVWLGHVNFYFSLCRPCLSTLSSCYRFAAVHLGHRAVVWQNVRKEMREVMGLIFLVERDLLAARSPLVHLGDSSMFGFSLMSTVATDAEIKRELEVKEKWGFIPGRLSLAQPGLRGPVERSAGLQTEYAGDLAKKVQETGPQRLRQHQQQLFGPPKTVVPTVMEAVRHPPIHSGWHDPTRWTLIQAAPWRDQKEHINPKEARVCLMGLRRWSRSSNHLGKIVFTLSDNMVSVLSYEKGRSSSAPMNRLVRRACAYIVGGRLQWRLRHIRTEHNPADRPSRLFDPVPHAPRTLPCEPPLCGHRVMTSFEQGGGDQGRVHSGRGALPAGDRMSSSEGLAAWEIFAGCGILTKSMVRRGFRMLRPLDLAHGPHHDLTHPAIQHVVIEQVKSGRIWYIHLGSPCTVFSPARHNIQNLREARRKERIGVQLAAFSARLAWLCLDMGLAFTIENPRGSRLWEFEPIQALLRDSRVYFIIFDACMFGAAYKKPTAILCNIQGLSGLARRCDGKHQHLQLRGTWRVRRGNKWVSESKTKTAGAYTASLAARWAELLAIDAPSQAFGSSLDFLAQVDGDLKDASRRPRRLVGPIGPAGRNVVLDSDVTKLLAAGVVFGQHSKEEADRLRSRRQENNRIKAAEDCAQG